MCHNFKIPLKDVGAPHSLVKAVDKMQDFDDSVKSGACRLNISCLKLYHRYVTLGLKLILYFYDLYF